MRAPYIPSEHVVKGLNAEPSAWIKRFCPLFSPNAKVLDMACGAETPSFLRPSETK